MCYPLSEYVYSHANISLQMMFSFFISAASNGVVIVTEKKLPSVLVDEKEVSGGVLWQFFLFELLHWGGGQNAFFMPWIPLKP